jgi:uncharacterized protein YigE (DUF2233 family)
MWRTVRQSLACALVWVLPAVGLSSAPAFASDDLCRPLHREGAEYVVCTVDLRRYQVRLFWKGSDGEPFGSLSRLRSAPEGARLLFAMNAGMYHEDRSPVGLYVENGREMRKANTASGRGNFHLKPNGIFFVRGATAGVMETSLFLRRRPKIDFATQSGPMLVINGRIHPRISDSGTSRKIRNGVGIRAPHTAVFVVSNSAVTFGEFAHLFRDELGCPDALFLDGSISSLYAPSLQRLDGILPVGPIVGALPRT